MSIKVICTDIDRTLIHEFRPDGLTIPQNIHSRHAISLKTIETLFLLQNEKKVKIILASGRRRSNYEKISSHIPHQFALIEHGGLIINQDGSEDLEWRYLLLPWIDKRPYMLGDLWKFEDKLKVQGFSVDSNGRKASFRVVSHPYSQSKDILQKNLPEGLSVVQNLERKDIIPSASGKKNALLFLLQKIGVASHEVVAIGDDVNDVEFLETVGYACTFCNAHPLALSVVKEREGFISTQTSHEGIQEILSHLISRA